MANGTNRIRLIQKSQPETVQPETVQPETNRIKLVSNGRPLTAPRLFTTEPKIITDARRKFEAETYTDVDAANDARLRELQAKVDTENRLYDSNLNLVTDSGIPVGALSKAFVDLFGTPSRKELAKLEAEIANRNAEKQEQWYHVLQSMAIPGYSDPATLAMLEEQRKKEQAEYEETKAELKAAADAEQAQVMSPANQYISMTTTMNDNPAVAALNYYINYLMQSKKQMEYEQFTAAETEAKKQEAVEQMQKWASEHDKDPLISLFAGEDKPGMLSPASIASVGTSLLSGADYLTNAVETAVTGNARPKGLPGLSETTQTLREGASGDMSNFWKFMYNTGMSAADSVIAGTVGGSTGAGVILGLGAASNAANDIKARGGTDGQALIGGAVSGILEGVFEKISIGELNAMRQINGTTWKTLLGNMAKSVLTNASEETATELGNIIFDTIFMNELSEYKVAMKKYMDMGISEESARFMAMAALRERVGAAALSGALMGLGFGAGSSAIAKASEYSANNKTYNINDTKSLINYAMSFPPETASYQMGEQLKGKKNITSAEEGALIRTISQDIEQGNNKANPAAETISLGGNVNGRVTAEIAPTAAQTAKETVSREPVEVIRMANAQAAQQNEKTASETQRNVFESNTEKKAPGFYSNDRFTGTSEETQYLDRLAKAAGISIEMSAMKDGRNGWIVNGEAHLSENATDPLRVVAKHEITHYLQDAAGDAYGQFRSYVENIYRSRGTLDQQIAAIQNLYRENGDELTWDGAMDELAADYAGELLDNEALIRKLAGEDRNLAQRILDGIRDLIRRVKTAFGSDEVKQLDRAARLWENALQEANEAYQRGDIVGTNAVRHSFGNIVGKTQDYGVGVILDTNIFDGVRTRDWGRVLSEYVYKNLAGTELTMYDDAGKPETVYLAKETDRVRKDGAKNSHKVLDKLARYKGDNIRALATVHLAEALEASENETSTDEHSHQWMDENGWTYRKAYLQDRNGNIYEATLNIANGRDRRILYDVNNIRKIDAKKEATGGVVPSTKNGGGSHTNGDYIDTVSQERKSVKGSRDLQKQIDALERQNRRLKEQMKRTDVPKVRREVVKRSAKDLRSMYSSKIDVNVLTDRIEALYNKISARSGAGHLQELKGVPSWADIRAESRSIADAILAESRGNVNPMAEEYSEIRQELRGRKISISDEYRADLESSGGYEGIRKQNFGTFSLTKDGTPIDTVYEELNEKYPVLFPDGIVHPADQLVRLSDVLQELKAVEGNPFENDLDATAQYLAGEIEERFYDTPNQKPTLADKMENTYHRQRLKDQKQLRAKLADQRRAYEKQVDEIHARYSDENRKRIENQNAAQRRETIYRHANRLGKMLERPTDKRHIPEQLRGAALHMLRYINTESNYQLAKGADGKYHRTDPMEVLYQRMYGGEASDVKETGRTAAARALKAVYDDILKEGELSVDPDIGDYLEDLAKMGNKPLGDMTRAELDTVWRVMQVVEHSITKANELHGEGRYRTVESMANALSEDVGNRKDRTNWAGPAGMVDQLLNRDMITPETFLHVLGDIGENIFRQMRNSADRQTAIVKEGSERAAKLIKESGVEFKKADKEHHTFHLDGGDLTLSTSQLMELYALSKRKQAMEHIYIGGLKSVGGVKGLKETGRSKPVKVTPADVSTMLDTLTDKQKALMDGLQAYLSGDLAKHGNEESLKVYGYEKFKEKNYWPIKVSRTETKSDPTSEARSKTIPGYGMTKAVIPKASNSVELRSAIDTFAAHLNQMATYASWLGTNEDVTRLHNFKFTDDQNRADGTVKELFERVYGKKGSAYIDALLSDIAQGTKTGADKTVIEGMFSRWKAAKVGGNLRVIVQQPTAILRAMSVMNPKYLAVSKNPLAGWKKALKYSPIAQWKDWGYFEMDTGRSIRELITGTESNLDKAKNAFMWGASAADSVAWGHLWNAVEAETADKHEELAKGSKEFYEAVAARFAEVVDRTQVVDSVLHRTQIMRSNSYAAKISTSFMSEPSKIYNMVVRDLYDLKNAGSDEKKTAAKKQLARTSSALIVSFAINAAAQALVDGLRDDERDKKYDEKFLAALPGNFASNFNPVSYIPYFKDVWSLIEGYTLNRSDMEGISDLVNAVGQLGKAMMGESEKTVLNAGLNAACRLGDLLGIPVSNLKRDAAAIFDTVLSDAELFELQYEVDKLRYNQDNASGVFYGDLYRSMNNDYDAYENIYEDMYEGMVEQGVSEDDAKEDIASAMENRMKKDLGVESVKSLPVRYSPPNSENPEDPFFALLKKARENDTGWVEQLDPGSIEIAHAVDEVRDQKAIEKIKVIASQPYGEELKKLAMRNVMSESLWEKYLKALNAGVTSEQYAEFLEAIAKEATQRTGKPDATAAQADVEAVLYRSKLSNAKKRAIWESYGWKAESPW